MQLYDRFRNFCKLASVLVWDGAEFNCLRKEFFEGAFATLHETYSTFS
jgi:hypothetical protein